MIFGTARTLAQIIASLASLAADVRALRQQGTLIMSALDNLKAAVAAQTTVDQSAVTLIQGLANQIGSLAASNNDAALQALADELTSATSPLAAAVTANTAQAQPPSTGSTAQAA